MENINSLDIPKGYCNFGNDVVCFPECLSSVTNRTVGIQDEINRLKVCADVLRLVEEDSDLLEEQKEPEGPERHLKL